MTYYVLQVAPRQEKKTEMYMKKQLPAGLYDRCFHPTRRMRRKYRGKWVEVHEKLLPGYVFVTTECAEELYIQLRKIPLFTRLLGKDAENFVRLSDEEEQWLDMLLGQMPSGEKNEVGLSQIAFGEGSEIRIVSGPLKDMQGMVKKINLHKRIAEIEVPFMGGKRVVFLGIEMADKKQSEDENV